MKKTTYFRACKDRNGYTFQAGEGYVTTFYNGFASLDLVFGKNQYNLWTITELSTGFLVHNETFLTRREAIAAITPEYFKKIAEKINESQCFEDARDRLSAYRSQNQV